MRTIFQTVALIPALILGAAAQTAQKEPFLAAALLIGESGSFERAWIVAATKSSIRYRETAVATETVDSKLSEFKSVYLFEPREYSVAMDLYQARKYEEARDKFKAFKEHAKATHALENSHAALAAFYEMECLRKLGDLEGLAAALQNFDKDPLTRDTHQRQLEIYLLWDAVRTSSWKNLDKLAAERAKTRMPGDQRAQVAYCHGLALEGLGKPEEALFAYQTAMTADAGSSEEIARQAALRVMAILSADAAVKRAIKDWDSPGQNKNNPGNAKLSEAAAVAKLYEMTLGAGSPLPEEFKNLLKYVPKKEAAKQED